ncbi:MAG TPA: tyrosine-type recombinase/integrase [Candidatus Sulfotelmatobacter sp.]|nr:tyrosine-type recombinase/integrase [Candidatus Sulfotelmatobacter sp.]
METSNNDLIVRYCSYLKSELNLAGNTLASYEHDVRDFSGWLEKSFLQTTRIDLQKYASDSLGEGLAPKTVARRLSCLRHFYRFLIDEEETQIDPTRNLPAPKAWNRIPKSLSLADLETMVGSLGSSWIGIRDKAILLTFFASGLRESELAALRLQDLDLDAGAAKVWNGKGGRDGIVPLSLPAVAALRLYLEAVRPKLEAATNEPTDHVFIGKRGRPLTRQQIYYRVRAIALAALGKHISPHFLRHGFATALVEGGADIRDVQVLMRHSSVDTTAIYVHIDLNSLRRMYYDSHPRARIAEAQN